MEPISELLGKLLEEYPHVYSPHGKKVVAFESHNMALPLWYTVASSLGSSINLVTFDYHSDTNSPFTNIFDMGFIERRAKIRKLVSRARLGGVGDLVSLADLIKNDEQICVFNELGVLNEAVIVNPRTADPCETQEYDAQMKLRTRRFNWVQSEDEVGPDLLFYVSKLDNLILDIDLDYFIRVPRIDTKWWRFLIEESALITIAMEPSYYDDLCSDNGVSASTLMRLLLESAE